MPTRRPRPFRTATMASSPFSCLLARLLLISTMYLSVTSAARMASPALHRRQAASPNSVSIRTTVHNQDGKDISSSFKTMIFHHRLPNATLSNATLAANLTDKRRSLSPRQSPFDTDYGEPYLMFRTILGCQHGTEAPQCFERSECNHDESAQAYTIWCRPYIRRNKRLGRQGKWCNIFLHLLLPCSSCRAVRLPIVSPLIKPLPLRRLSPQQARTA